MDLNLGEVKILIKASDFDKAFKDAKAYFEDSENIRADEWNSLEDVFDEFGYNLLTNDAGAIVDLDVISSDLPDGQCAFFESIAKSVEDGSYVCLTRENRHWKLVFENGKCRCLDSEIAYHDKPMSYDRAMCLLSEIVEHTCVAKKTSEAIEHLFRLGFTDDELTDVFNFGKDDVDDVIREIEEENI